MTKPAWLFLCLTLATGIAGVSSASEDGQTTAFVASGIFATFWLLSLIVGRRFKFDPVLR